MLFIFLASVTPFWTLGLVFRLMDVPPPQWLGDALALALLVVGISVVCKAIRERRLARQATAQAALARGPMSQALQASLPCMVHEIRNYSSILKGNASLLRSLAAAGSDLEPLGRLERTAQKIESLAQEILEATTSARLDSQERICVLALLETCLAEHFYEARDAIRFTAEGPLPAIEGDPRRLERVFINLFKNSFEAGAASIRVSLVSAPNRLRVLVEDDGIGCDSEDIGKLFRPLYSTKKDKGGTGLGLFMIKTIMEAHGGSIRPLGKSAWAGNRKGMIFCLEFPISRQETLAMENQDWDHPHNLSLGGIAGG